MVCPSGRELLLRSTVQRLNKQSIMCPHKLLLSRLLRPPPSDPNPFLGLLLRDKLARADNSFRHVEFEQSHRRRKFNLRKDLRTDQNSFQRYSKGY